MWAPPGASPAVAFRRFCWRRPRVSADGPGPRRFAASISTSAADGCTPPSAIPGPGSRKATGVPIEQSRAAWGVQYRNLGFTPAEQAEAWKAFEAWNQRLAQSPPATDCAADALDPGCDWNTHIRAIVSFISGATLEQLSAADYVAYDESSSENNWRLRSGYGALVARSFPRGVSLGLATPVESIALAAEGVTLATPDGRDSRAGGDPHRVDGSSLGRRIQLPGELDPWREAARQLPLGLNEKLFFEIVGEAPFEAETHVTGNPRDERTASYYIRPYGWPVIECFFGGERARLLARKVPPRVSVTRSTS